MKRPKILLVDQYDQVRHSIQRSLGNDFDVLSAATVSDAVGLILREDFNGLVINLRGASDFCILVAATQYFQSSALIVAVSDSLNIQEAILAIRLRADIIVKPSNIREISQLLYATRKSFLTSECNLSHTMRASTSCHVP
jgi:DNA-binding response OmpR family regulator